MGIRGPDDAVYLNGVGEFALRLVGAFCSANSVLPWIIYQLLPESDFGVLGVW